MVFSALWFTFHHVPNHDAPKLTTINTQSHHLADPFNIKIGPRGRPPLDDSFSANMSSQHEGINLVHQPHDEGYRLIELPMELEAMLDSKTAPVSVVATKNVGSGVYLADRLCL